MQNERSIKLEQRLGNLGLQSYNEEMTGKNEVKRIAKQMAKKNQDIVGKKYIRKDVAVLVTNEKVKKGA